MVTCRALVPICRPPRAKHGLGVKEHSHFQFFASIVSPTTSSPSQTPSRPPIHPSTSRPIQLHHPSIAPLIHIIQQSCPNSRTRPARKLPPEPLPGPGGHGKQYTRWPAIEYVLPLRSPALLHDSNSNAHPSSCSGMHLDLGSSPYTDATRLHTGLRVGRR